MKQLLLNSIVILFLSKGIALKTNSHHKLKLGLRETLVLNKILENKKNQNSIYRNRICYGWHDHVTSSSKVEFLSRYVDFDMQCHLKIFNKGHLQV